MAKAQKVVTQKHNMNTPEKLEAIKAAIIAGETPKSIHEKYGTSIVNIHYHKAQLRKQGLLSDNKKATKKTTTAKSSVAKKETKTSKVATPKTKVTKSKVASAPKIKEAKVAPVVAKEKAVTKVPSNGPLSFVIGDTKVSIDKSAKSVKVGKKSVTIEF